jgi:hypothetical protein
MRFDHIFSRDLPVVAPPRAGIGSPSVGLNGIRWPAVFFFSLHVAHPAAR